MTEFSSHSDDSTSTISEDELERSVDMSDDISSNDIIDGGDKKEVKITIGREERASSRSLGSAPVSRLLRRAVVAE